MCIRVHSDKYAFIDYKILANVTTKDVDQVVSGPSDAIKFYGSLKANDEVIMPALTFVANANVIKLSGCKPILADSDSLVNPNVSLKTIKDVRCLAKK